MEIKYIVEEDNISLRDFLINKGHSRNFRKKIRLYDVILINGEVGRNHHILHIGDEIIIKVEEELNPDFILNETELDIIFEDEYFLIINKPPYFSTQPSRKHPQDNIISLVAAYYKKQNIKTNIHIITRLDYLTTGLMLIAKNGLIHQIMEKVQITKKYICKIKGQLSPLEGLIDLPIKRIKEYDIRRWVTSDGARSMTKYQTCKIDNNESYLEVELLTGRTHQIRVHMAYLGHPIVGENLYDEQSGPLHLHCTSLFFIHPFTKNEIKVTTKPPWA